MRKTSSSFQELTDTHQSIWELSVIQLSGWMSLPILTTSALLLQFNSFSGALLTIALANGILWLIRLGIILMSYQGRQSTLDISRSYLGNRGAYFIAALLLISTLAWFIAQTTGASKTLVNLINIKEPPEIDQFIQMSVLLGIVSTFFCMQGIKILKKLTVVAFPLMIIALIIALFVAPFEFPKDSDQEFSLCGLGLMLSTHLGITADLPTFFRHSRSLKTSIGALTVIQLISLALAVCALYLGAVIKDGFEINAAMIFDFNNETLRLSLIALVFLSVISANVANVYSASVGWEVIAPSALVGRKEYLILGLGLTTIFILVSDLLSMQLLLEASDSSLMNLSMTLVLGYLISKGLKKQPGHFEKQTYFTAWLLSTLINALQYYGVITWNDSPLIAGLASILLIVLAARFMKRIGLVQNES